MSLGLLIFTSPHRGSKFTGAVIALKKAFLMAVMVAKRAKRAHMREKQLPRRPSVTPCKT